jgi:capsular exopolysaccharide synthesis family protein
MLRPINKRALITDSNPQSPIAEAYRALRTHLQFLGDEGSLQVITASSALPGEGKTTTLLNMAVVFAHEGKKVAVVDGDMRRPAIHEVFQVTNDIGLSSYLRHPYTLADVVCETNIPNLDVIPSGPIPPNPSELLGSARMDSLILQLREKYDIVLIDAPPVLVVTDGKLIASKCDGVVLVVHSKKSKRDMVRKAKEQLERVKANVLGVVLNGKRRSEREAFDTYYYGKAE